MFHNVNKIILHLSEKNSSQQTAMADCMKKIEDLKKEMETKDKEIDKLKKQVEAINKLEQDKNKLLKEVRNRCTCTYCIVLKHTCNINILVAMYYVLQYVYFYYSRCRLEIKLKR